jgi:hypothetical protein
VTVSGTMPTFAAAGARRGYLQKRTLHRAEQIGAALLSLEAAEAFAAVRAGGERHEHTGTADARDAAGDGTAATCTLRVASVGGAGGSDALGLVLLSDYLRVRQLKVDCTVFEYEQGWNSAVRALNATPLVRATVTSTRRQRGLLGRLRWVTSRRITSRAFDVPTEVSVSRQSNPP